MIKSLAHVTVHWIMVVAVVIGLGAVPVLLLGGGPFLLLLTTVLIQSAFEKAPQLSERQLVLALEDLGRRGFQPGMHRDVVLPPPLRPMTKMGTVDLFKTVDGRMIVLFKTSLGFKGNFRGIVFSDAPLKPEDFGICPFGRPSIMLDGFPSTIRKRINLRHYEVFNDYG